MAGGVRRYLSDKYRETFITAGRVREKISPVKAGSDGENPVGRSGVRLENMVWIFGSGRSGTTWLRAMMCELPNHHVWEEPLVGRMFGSFYEAALDSNLERPEFILGNATRNGWSRSIRNFILDGAGYARPLVGRDGYLVVKEPNGSVGAPLIMRALPESRMILVVRDPRDVVASVLDGGKKGNWLNEWRGGSGRDSMATSKPDVFVKKRTNIYMRDITGARRAYEEHRGSKSLVRYEDLLSDTQREMERIYTELDLPLDRTAIGNSVEKHSWKNIAEDRKGDGKFYRKGSPGSWTEDLTPKQIEIVEDAAEPILREFYPNT